MIVILGMLPALLSGQNLSDPRWDKTKTDPLALLWVQKNGLGDRGFDMIKNRGWWNPTITSEASNANRLVTTWTWNFGQGRNRAPSVRAYFNFEKELTTVGCDWPLYDNNRSVTLPTGNPGPKVFDAYPSYSTVLEALDITRPILGAMLDRSMLTKQAAYSTQNPSKYWRQISPGVFMDPARVEVYYADGVRLTTITVFVNAEFLTKKTKTLDLERGVYVETETGSLRMASLSSLPVVAITIEKDKKNFKIEAPDRLSGRDIGKRIALKIVD